MALQTVKVSLPEKIYRKVSQLAEDKSRSFEDELVHVLTQLVTEDDEWLGISEKTESEVSQLRFLDTKQLWSTAKMRVPDEKSERMQALTLKLKSEGLIDAEEQELRQLQLLGQHVMLVRAQATDLLHQRGEDISNLRS